MKTKTGGGISGVMGIKREGSGPGKTTEGIKRDPDHIGNDDMNIRVSA